LHFNFKRFDGLYNLAGEWVNAEISDANQKKINSSFEIFIALLQKLLTVEFAGRFSLI
jgi:hypothetical protein